jgi:hypothetical protein
VSERRLVKHRTTMRRHPGTDIFFGAETSQHVKLGEVRMPFLQLRPEIADELPDEITVTIEPGNLLEDES